MEAWLTLRTPTGVHCWPLQRADHEAEVLAARQLAGFPADEAWVDQPNGFDLAIGFGRPHPTTLAQAVVHDPTELAGVDTAAYASALRQSQATARQADALARWEALPEESKAEVLARRTAAPAPVKGRT